MVQLIESASADTPHSAPEKARGGFPAAVVLDWLGSPENFWVRNWTESKKSDTLVVSGTLKFACAYNKASGQIDIFSDQAVEGNMNRPFFVEDGFQVEIRFPANSIPEIRETEGRIARIAKQRKTLPYHLHTKPDGSCCLGYQQELRRLTTNAAGLRNYFAGFVIPFFYSRSGEDRGMKIPGWGEYGHGLLGVLEYYYEKGAEMSDDAFARVLQDMYNSTREPPKKAALGGSYKCNPRLWWHIVGCKKIKPKHTYYRDDFTNGSKRKFLLPRKHCLALKMMAARHKRR